MFDRDEREILTLLKKDGGEGAETLMCLIEDAIKYGEPDSYTESVLTGIYDKLRIISERGDQFDESYAE